MPAMRPEREGVPECALAASDVLPRLFAVGEEPAVDGTLEGNDYHDATLNRKHWVAPEVIAVVEAVAQERNEPHEHINCRIYEHIPHLTANSNVLEAERLSDGV